MTILSVCLYHKETEVYLNQIKNIFPNYLSFLCGLAGLVLVYRPVNQTGFKPYEIPPIGMHLYNWKNDLIYPFCLVLCQASSSGLSFMCWQLHLATKNEQSVLKPTGPRL